MCIKYMKSVLNKQLILIDSPTFVGRFYLSYFSFIVTGILVVAFLRKGIEIVNLCAA